MKPDLSDVYFLMLHETGSRVYGTPTKDSDWDYFACVHGPSEFNETVERLESLGFDIGGSLNTCDFDPNAFCSLKRDNANIILLHHQEFFKKWFIARDECVKRRPVSRQVAVAIHKEVLYGNVGLLKEVSNET